MPVLKSVQDDFQRYLTKGDSSIRPEIVDDARLGANKRLRIYFDAYRIRLNEILKLDFPKTHTLLGDDAMDEAFSLYLENYPSTHFSVRYFGRHFSQFLASTKPYADFPVFAEMALFEWSVSHTLDAKDASIVTQEALTQVDPEQWADLVFSFHPSVMSQLFYWDVPQLWQDIEQEKEPRQPKRQETPVRWVFWRKGLRSLFQSCTQTENIMFQGVLEKKSFAEICEDLIDIVPEDAIPMSVAQTLFKWISDEMIAK